MGSGGVVCNFVLTDFGVLAVACIYQDLRICTGTAAEAHGLSRWGRGRLKFWLSDVGIRILACLRDSKEPITELSDQLRGAVVYIVNRNVSQVVHFNFN